MQRAWRALRPAAGNGELADGARGVGWCDESVPTPQTPSREREKHLPRGTCGDHPLRWERRGRFLVAAFQGLRVAGKTRDGVACHPGALAMLARMRCGRSGAHARAIPLHRRGRIEEGNSHPRVARRSACGGPCSTRGYSPAPRWGEEEMTRGESCVARGEWRRGGVAMRVIDRPLPRAALKERGALVHGDVNQWHENRRACARGSLKTRVGQRGWIAPPPAPPRVAGGESAG